MSFPAYDEYKESGVEWLGEVPAYWDVRRLKFVSDIQTGDKDTVDAEEDGEFPFFVRSQTVERISTKTFDCEAILTAGDGVGVGKVFHYHEGPFDFHQRVYMMNNFRNVDGRFLFHYLKANFYKVALEGGAKSTVDSIRRPMLTDFPVSFPPCEDEQKAISSFLDVETSKIDGLVSEQRRLIELLKEKRQAVISHAVTKGLNPNAPMKPSGIQWLGDVPQHWGVIQLKWFSTLQRGYDLTKDEFEEGAVPVVTSGGITGTHSVAMAKGPGVVTGRYGSTGHLFYVEEDFWPHNTTLFVLDFHGNNERFVWYSLQTVDFASHSAKSAVPGIDRNDIHVLPVTVPPVVEQIAIAQYLDDRTAKFDSLEAEAERAIDLLQERRTALISAAVTGKIDVRGFSPQDGA